MFGAPAAEATKCTRVRTAPVASMTLTPRRRGPKIGAGMKQTRLTVQTRTILERLLPRLRGRVFHVTSEARLRAILLDGVIRTNHDGALGETYPQSAGCVGRLRQCVCLFDGRGHADDVLTSGICCYGIPGPLGHELAFLFVAEAAHARLVRPAPADFAIGTCIPHVESWFPGDLPLTLVDEVLRVHVRRPPGITLADILEESRRQR